jgi:hypothetical protein
MKKIGLAVVVGVALITLGVSNGFSQVPVAQDRIVQPVIINGQQLNAAYVTAPGGGVQSFSCSAPQQYMTPDGAGQGWACYDATTGYWLLNAVPPAQVQVQTPPAVVYQQAPPVIYRTSPQVVYAAPPVVVAPAYPPSVVLGSAAINAAGRIAAAAIFNSHGPRVVYYPYHGRRW